MAREKEGFREALEQLSARFPEREAISLAECAEILGLHKETIAGDKTFPVMKIGNRRLVSLVALARRMV
ncbi:MAG: hypothetical protein LBN00_03750 [Oscillospiraceae bacterium]|jgi:hypothetical protein|nr:hypothetical protein [Oscillospiraceae bacterium]